MGNQLRLYYLRSVLRPTQRYGVPVFGKQDQPHAFGVQFLLLAKIGENYDRHFQSIP